MNKTLNIKINNLDESYEIDKVAKQANGAVLLQIGKAVLLGTVTCEFDNPVDEDFLPLTVQYIEKSYAFGKFPSGFVKREAKPSDLETLNARIIDRSIRPLFPKGFRYPTVINVLVLSADPLVDFSLAGLNVASAALMLSNINIQKNVSGVRLTKIDNELVINPTTLQLASGDFDIFVAGSGDELLMIEMKANKGELSEEELIKTLELAQKSINNATTTYKKEFSQFAKQKFDAPLNIVGFEQSVYDFIRSNYSNDLKNAINNMAKSERNSELKNLAKKVIEANPSFSSTSVTVAVEKLKKELVRAQILNDKIRADGRALDEIRPITIETNILPSAHGSCLFTRGQTQALVVATLGGEKDAQSYEILSEKSSRSENFMVHYNFPSFSVGEASTIGPVSRRELGHGNLAKRALEPIIVLEPKETIRVVSEILESNGSSSMATVCGGSLALKAMGIEIKALVAGVAMGLVVEDDKYAVLTDIMGLEDHDGDMDFKVAGTKNGITAMQMDIKLGGLELNILKDALSKAKTARLSILEKMEIASEKIKINDGVIPKSETFIVDVSKIVMIIGKGGSTIKSIVEDFDVSIDLDKESGKVKIKSMSGDNIAKAKAKILEIVGNAKTDFDFTQIYKIDEHMLAKITRLTDFGAFVELPRGGEGLVHISKFANHRVSKISDVATLGDEIEVRVLAITKDRIELAHKDFKGC